MKKAVLLFFIAASTFNAHSQMTGVFTIGGNEPDFETISEAFQELENAVYYTDIVLNVRPGEYNEQLSFTGEGIAPDQHNILLQPENGENESVIISWENTGNQTHVEIIDTWHITFSNLTFKNLSTTSAGKFFKFSGNTRNIEISGCRFETMLENPLLERQVQMTSGFLRNFRFLNNHIDAANVAVDLAVYLSDSILIYNNQIDSVYQSAVRITDASEVEITSNEIGWMYENGIDISFSGNVLIDDNQFNTVVKNALSVEFVNEQVIVANNSFNGTIEDNMIAISQGGFDPPASIIVSNNEVNVGGDGEAIISLIDAEVFEMVGNKIDADEAFMGTAISVVNSNSNEFGVSGNEIYAVHGSTGIELQNVANADLAEEFFVASNMIAGYEEGIKIEDSENLLLAHNSISSFGDCQSAVVLAEIDGLEMHNNALKHYGINNLNSVLHITSVTNFTSTHNVYDFPQDENNYYLSNNYNTLSDAQLNGIEQESSVAEIAYFNDTTNLRTCGENLFQSGTPIQEGAAGIDIDEIERSATSPTVGAQEVLNEDGTPQVDFELTFDDLEVTTENLTLQAEEYLWDFGDGFTSEEFEPVHTYDFEGENTISLTATNQCGSDETELTIILPGVQEKQTIKFSCFPNPTSGVLKIDSEQELTGATVQIFDQQGRNVSTQLLAANRLIQLRELPQGVYLVRVETKDYGVFTQKVIKQ